MKTIITNVEKYEFGDSFEVKCYEAGSWQHDSYHENIEDAITRMNVLMQKYDFKEDEVQVVRNTYYKNITEELPF